MGGEARRRGDLVMAALLWVVAITVILEVLFHD
jgi:hypothetical protein